MQSVTRIAGKRATAIPAAIEQAGLGPGPFSGRQRARVRREWKHVGKYRKAAHAVLASAKTLVIYMKSGKGLAVAADLARQGQPYVVAAAARDRTLGKQPVSVYDTAKVAASAARVRPPDFIRVDGGHLWNEINGPILAKEVVAWMDRNFGPDAPGAGGLGPDGQLPPTDGRRPTASDAGVPPQHPSAPQAGPVAVARQSRWTIKAA